MRFKIDVDMDKTILWVKKKLYSPKSLMVLAFGFFIAAVLFSDWTFFNKLLGWGGLAVVAACMESTSR